MGAESFAACIAEIRARVPGTSVEVVIPDFQAITAEGTVRGIVLTHGHEDHVGGLAYLLKVVQAPVYGTPLTLGLARRRVEESKDTPKMKGIPTNPRRSVRIGPFDVAGVPADAIIGAEMAWLFAGT